MGAVAACGSSGPNAADLLPFFDNNSIRLRRPQRFVFGLGDKDHVVLKSGPQTIAVEFFGPNGASLGPVASVMRHNQAIPRAYWPATATIPSTGIFKVRATVSGKKLETEFQVTADSPVPAPGDKMPALDSPTMADHRGVQQVCTRDPVCPLHDITLTEALALGKPVAFMVGTPAYCQTGVCGPVLEVLLAEYAKRKTAIHFLHAEVYAVPYKDSSTPLSPTVDALQLSFEPALFLAGADGVIRERLDILYDLAELSPALDRLLA